MRDSHLGTTSTVPPAIKHGTARPHLSVVTAAFNERDNLDALYEKLRRVLDGAGADWEWIIVDDHSTDDTFACAQRIAECDGRVRVIRFSRNFGSHTAMTCGLLHSRGDCAVVLAADLQDPPDVIPRLLTEWRAGAQIVWAARGQREGESVSKLGFSRLYYLLMRRLVGMQSMPVTGADFFLVDRRVLDALQQFRESNVSLLALLTWMGFSQSVIYYDKQRRLHGSSGWSLEKKLKLVVDSVTGFSYLPIRLMSAMGLLFAAGGFCWTLVVIVGRIAGFVVAGTGYAAIMTVLLFGFGFLMLFLGVLGEYLWRTFDEVRGRPRFIVERTVNMDTLTASSAAGAVTASAGEIAMTTSFSTDPKTTMRHTSSTQVSE